MGFQRCGTTYLANILKQHPNIQFASPIYPEPKYFMNVNSNKKEFISKYFLNDDRKYCYGEKSTSYIEDNEAAKRIKFNFPKAKIIISARNPVERALSNYFFSKKNNLENRTLEEVFIHNLPEPNNNLNTSVNPFNYLIRSSYKEYINDYIQVFGLTNIHLVHFEKLKTNSYKEINKVISFLDLEGFIVDIDVKTNYSIRDEVSHDVLSILKKKLKKEIKYFDSLFK